MKAVVLFGMVEEVVLVVKALEDAKQLLQQQVKSRLH